MIFKYLLPLLLMTSPTLSKEYTPESIQQNNLIFERCNQFTFRYGFVIKVAEIAWYSPNCGALSLLETESKILRFHYFKDVKAGFFKDSAEEYFILNLNDDPQKQALIEAMNQFNNGYTHIESGDYFQLVHTNNSKLSLFKNDELLMTTENADLSQKYFHIWFGKEPVIEKLKTAFD